MTNIESMSLDDIVRFVENKYNVSITISDVAPSSNNFNQRQPLPARSVKSSFSQPQQAQQPSRSINQPIPVVQTPAPSYQPTPPLPSAPSTVNTQPKISPRGQPSYQPTPQITQTPAPAKPTENAPQRKGSVLDRWNNTQDTQKISPGLEEARRLTAHVSVKERREEIEKLLKQVEGKFSENDFASIAREEQERQRQAMLKQQQEEARAAQLLKQQQQQQGANARRPPVPVKNENEEPAMLNVPDNLMYSLQINTVLELLAMRQWRQAEDQLRQLEPHVQVGTKEDIFIKVVWSVYYNNYGVDLANQNNFRDAYNMVMHAKQLCERLTLKNFQYIDHEYSYWAVLLNTQAIIAQTFHRENKHNECAKVHTNAYDALMGVLKNTNPNSPPTMNKKKMYAVNAIIFGIHAMDKNLLHSGVDLLYPFVATNRELGTLLGHGYKNIGILELKANNNDMAKKWFDAAMSLY
ncbi:hypothetical protein AKO1_014150 [Acrasis kona]|uniref:Uncharacterized protein n=1 Tax=Acrasis kona TaxID=1008807 RepID=A0AAW2Z2N5_9EUKA